MRTGAIFARGSCQALKWLALFGVVVTLGVGQAAAQPVTTATYDGTTVTVTYTSAVRASDSTLAANGLASLFTIDGVAATAETVSRDAAGAATFTLTFASLTGTPTVRYRAPRDTSAARLVHATGAGSAVGDFSVVAYSQDANLPLIENKTAVVGRTANIVLPEAMGGDGDLTYSLTGLPTGGTLAFTAASRTIGGVPAAADVGEHQLTYAVANAGTGDGDSTQFYLTVTATGDRLTGKLGQITEFKLVGDVMDKTIAGTERHHVPEGSQGVDLSVTVQWTHEEIAQIGYNTPQTIEVEIKDGRAAGMALPSWLSWIDTVGQDVHFPRTAGAMGTVTIRTPRITEIPEAQRGSPRHVKSKTGTLDVLILHDDHEAENDAFYIEATGGDVDVMENRGATYKTTLDVVIEDDEDQKVRIRNSKYSTGPTSLYEPAGDSTIDSSPSFLIDAVPPRKDLPLEVRLDIEQGQTVSSAQISLGEASMTLNEDGTGTSNSGWVDVNLPDSDGNRMDDTYSLNASVNVYSVATGGYRTIPAAEHSITVLDRHRLPWLVDEMLDPMEATVTEGGMVELEVTIHRNPSNTFVGPAAINSDDVEKRLYSDEEVTVMLSMGAGSTATAGDYSIMPASVTFPERTSGSYTASMTVEVMAMEDDDLDDMEMLVLDAAVSGAVTAHGADGDMYMGVSTVTIEEGTMSLVWVKEDIEAAVMAAKEAGMGDDMMFTAGEMIELKGSDLFGSAEGVSVGYATMVEGDAVSAGVSGGMITITADSMGMADVTITARASRPSGALVINDQTDPREASITIALEVGLVALSIMLEGPDDMNLVEGGMGGMVTATANRMVTEDTKVMLMRDRSKSSADDMDYTADPITILAGQMSGSTMVMATADEMMENMDNMPEELVLYGMAEDMAGEVTGEVKFYLWDAAVPALPIIAQLLLAAFLAIGGYRRYRRR